MGKSLASVASVLLLWASLGSLSGPAAADITFPLPFFTHEQVHRATVDLGPWKGYTVRFRTVRPGETLGRIAREHLGSFKRWKEIGALNSLDPNAIPSGTEILLPPVNAPLSPGTGPDPKRPDAREWWDFFVLRGPTDGLVRHRPGKPLPTGAADVRLVAVRHDKTAEVLKRVADDPAGAIVALDALAPTAAAWLARSEVLARHVTVKNEDPVHTVERHWRVTALAGGRIELEKTFERRLGRDGREATAPAPPQPPPQPIGSDPVPEHAGPPARWDLVLVFLALLAAIGIAVVHAQRSRRRPSDPTSSTASA